MMTVMTILRLTLNNFRNYHSASLDTGVKSIVLVGPNGAGKTNLIEAISFFAPGRGLRRATLDEVAFAEGDGSWAVSAEIEGALGLATLGTGIERPLDDGSAVLRKCRIDREPVGSAAAFADHLRVVWLTPAMDTLFSGAPSERRRFIDRLALAVDADHGSRAAGSTHSSVHCARATGSSKNRGPTYTGSTPSSMKPPSLPSPLPASASKPCAGSRQF
jgi:DNA replication and repair protein RecF